MDAVRVLPIAGLERRVDCHATLSALFLTRHEQQAVFDDAFAHFWSPSTPEEREQALRLPKVRGPLAHRPVNPGRVREAMMPLAAHLSRNDEAAHEVTVDATLTFSATERLKAIDFERMTLEEWNAARRAISQLRLPVPMTRTRRYRPLDRGPSIDLARTLRRMARDGGELTHVVRRARIERMPPLVVLCDISGSMHRYTRMFLHFVHALARDRGRVSAFVFGTRLTNVTRPLRDRDVDEALAKMAAIVPDWAGARASARACASSISAGRAGSSRRMPASSWSPTASTATMPGASPPRWRGCIGRAGDCCGSTRSPLRPASSRGRAASPRCSPMSTNSCRCTTSPRSRTWRARCAGALNGALGAATAGHRSRERVARAQRSGSAAQGDTWLRIPRARERHRVHRDRRGRHRPGAHALSRQAAAGGRRRSRELRAALRRRRRRGGLRQRVARVRLSEESGGTLIDYSASSQIGGRLAQVGNRLVDSVARKLAEEFFASLEAQLGSSPAAVAAPHAPRRDWASDPRVWAAIFFAAVVILVVLRLTLR
jgi:hypothetical protein